MKTYTEEDMKAAYEAATDSASFDYMNDSIDQAVPFEEWLEDYNLPSEESAQQLSFPWWLVKKTCNWSGWCDVTGGNHYAMQEFGELEKDHLLYCTKKEAEELGLI
jgi:hypothetical protein